MYQHIPLPLGDSVIKVDDGVTEAEYKIPPEHSTGVTEKLGASYLLAGSPIAYVNEFVYVGELKTGFEHEQVY